MIRLSVFFFGLVLAAWSLPAVLEHHQQAQLMQLAWCSSSGRAASGAAWLAAHCAACPAFLAGLVVMSSVALSGLIPVARLHGGRA